MVADHQIVGHVAWFAVTTAGSVGIWAAARTAQRWTPQAGRPPVWRAAAVAAAGALVVMLALGGLYNIHAIASGDAHVIDYLSRDRGTSLSGVMYVVTTMGDVVPSFMLAAVFAAVTFHLTRRPVVFILPLVILVQLIVQAIVIHVVSSYRVGEIYPQLPLGGSEGIPSGSMSRLLSLFVLGSVIWAAHSRRVSAVIFNVGLAAITVEFVSRVYLGRHMLADIAGGLLLGIALSVVFGSVIYLVEARLPASRRARTPAVED